MPNSRFGHDRDRDCINDLFYHLRIALMDLNLDIRFQNVMNVHTIRATPPIHTQIKISLFLSANAK